MSGSCVSKARALDSLNCCLQKGHTLTGHRLQTHCYKIIMQPPFCLNSLQNNQLPTHSPQGLHTTRCLTPAVPLHGTHPTMCPSEGQIKASIIAQYPAHGCTRSTQDQVLNHATGRSKVGLIKVESTYPVHILH